MLNKVQFRPGIDKENTEYGAEGAWVDCDKVRFRFGLPQKIGGWLRIASSAMVGAVRGIKAWFDLAGIRYIGLGTNKKVYVFTGGNLNNITPIRQSNTSLTNMFTTTNGSSNVTVAVTNHGAATGDFAIFSNVSNLTTGTSFVASDFETGEFEIQGIANSSAFYIQMPSNEANAGITSTGDGDADFELSVEPDIQTQGYGWGTSTWSASTWGTARATSNVVLNMGMWSFDNAGEDLYGWKKDGGTYVWDTSAGVTQRMVAVNNAPTSSITGLVSTPDRHLVCFGTETTIGDPSTQEDMFVRWSDQENFTQWTANAINTAGSQRLAQGSRIVTAKKTRNEILIWTDQALHTMQFIGPPFTFGFKLLGTDCGALGLNSAVIVNDTAYWMSEGRFMMYRGGIQELPCTVKTYVFNDINTTQNPQIYAGENNTFNEVIWFYCSANSSQVDRYVIYNYLENTWYIGTLDRTAWIDQGVFSVPQATEYDANSTAATTQTLNGVSAGRSFIYEQETGTTDNGNVMSTFITSGDVDIADGDQFMFIRGYIPDFKNLQGTVKMNLLSREFPTDTQTESGEIDITSGTKEVNTRSRGRQIAVKISSDSSVDDQWRFGTLRVDARPDGRR
jgi:hypothetical protein